MSAMMAAISWSESGLRAGAGECVLMLSSRIKTSAQLSSILSAVARSSFRVSFWGEEMSRWMLHDARDALQAAPGNSAAGWQVQ
jgi:hypothetical protein